MKTEGLTIKGHVQIFLRDPETGIETLVEEGDNVVTTVGLALFAQWIADTNTTTRVDYCALGNDNTAATSAQTALVSEVKRNAVTFKVCSGAVATIATVFTAYEANGYTIKEAGLFTASSSGTMVSRFVLGTAVTKDASMELVVKWTITIS
jgi:hypothetical protein